MPSLIVMVLLSVVVALFAIQNATAVVLDFIIWEFEISLVLVILGSFLCGVLVAMLYVLHLKYKNYRQRKKMNQEIIDLENKNSQLEERIKMLMYNQRRHGGNNSWSDTSSLEDTLATADTSKQVSDSASYSADSTKE